MDLREVYLDGRTKARPKRRAPGWVWPVVSYLVLVGLAAAFIWACDQPWGMNPPSHIGGKYSIEACAIHGGIQAESKTALMCRDRAEWMDDGYEWMRVDASTTTQGR